VGKVDAAHDELPSYSRVATIREWHLLNFVNADGMEDKEIHCLKRGGVAADTRESIQRDTTTLTTATDTELEESDPFADVEEDKDELEENEFVHYTCTDTCAHVQ